MQRSQIAAAIAAMREGFVIEFADTADAQIEAMQLRYQVYCKERGFEPGQDGIEKDQFDHRARHVLVRARRSGRAVGTVRLVRGAVGLRGPQYPMQLATDLPRLRQLPATRTAEVSRFAISKSLRGECAATFGLLRLCLLRGIVALSGELGLTHWCALMEPTLLRLLQMSAIYFQPIGPLVEHHGMRQPSIGPIRQVLDRIRQDCPEVWGFITESGQLWQEARIEQAI